MVAPVFQTLPLMLLELSATLLPAQNVLLPLEVIVGVAGGEITLTVTDVVGETQLLEPVTKTEYTPDVLTTMY